MGAKPSKTAAAVLERMRRNPEVAFYPVSQRDEKDARRLVSLGLAICSGSKESEWFGLPHPLYSLTEAGRAFANAGSWPPPVVHRSATAGRCTRGEWSGQDISNEGGAMTYRERREARAERLQEWAGKREDRAAVVFEAGEPFRGDIAFNTQPGHIPFRARLIAREHRAHESLGKAASMRSRADGIAGQLATSVYSDDPDAVEQLRERIARLEAERDAAKAVNAAYRKEHKAELAAMEGKWERDQAMPHPGWYFQNLSGNLARQRKRLAGLEGA